MNHYVGIDISAKTVDISLVNCNNQTVARQFQQTPAGHRQLVALACKHKVKAIVMEATGIYYLDLALALHKAKLPVTVINPKAFHHFAKANLSASKTDQIDAKLLAEYARRMPLENWQPPSQELLALRDLARRINQLNGLKAAEKNRLHALQAKRYTDKILICDLQDHIEQLDQRIDRMTQAAMAYIKANSVFQRQYSVITTTKGIAQASAIAILGELLLLPKEMKAKQVSCHAGLDVRLTQSGSSLNRPGRLSKTGNVYLRSALFMPSLSFVAHDPIAKAHYRHLQERGKKKLQALSAIQRKMLTGLWACMHSGEAFDSARLFKIRPNTC